MQALDALARCVQSLADLHEADAGEHLSMEGSCFMENVLSLMRSWLVLTEVHIASASF